MGKRKRNDSNVELAVDDVLCGSEGLAKFQQDI